MGPTSRIVTSQVWYEFRQQGLKCNLQTFSNGRLMEFILDQPCIPFFSRLTAIFIITKSFSYFSLSFFQIFFSLFFNKLSSLGRFPSFNRACSVPRRVYLVIPQVSTRFQQAYSVPQLINLLNPFSIRGSYPNASTTYRYSTNHFSYEGVVGEQL